MNLMKILIYNPAAWLLNLFNSWFGSYALALLLFALAIKLILFPLAVKQQKSMIKGALLRPKLELINRKYAGRNDKPTMDKKNREIMELQQKEGYSPLSGCLPLLVQLPIIIGLYEVIRNPLTHLCKFSEAAIDAMKKAADTSKDQITLLNALQQQGIDEVTTEAGETVSGILAKLPNFHLFGNAVNLAEVPSLTNFSLLLLVPVLAFAGAYLSMFVTRKCNAPMQVTATTPDQQVSNRMMEFTGPIMSLVLSFMVSAALGLYWFFQSIFTVFQTLLLNKILPPPTFTDEELKAIMRAEKEKEKGRAPSRANRDGRPAVRSLHHIDDDDYETPEPAPKNGKQGTKKPAPASTLIAPQKEKATEKETEKETETSGTSDAENAAESNE